VEFVLEVFRKYFSRINYSTSVFETGQYRTRVSLRTRYLSTRFSPSVPVPQAVCYYNEQLYSVSVYSCR